MNELESEEKRNLVYDTLKQNNIFSRKYFYPLTADADCYAGRFSNDNIDVARDISKRVLVLPLYPELEDEVIEEIVRVIGNAVLGRE